MTQTTEVPNDGESIRRAPLDLVRLRRIRLRRGMTQRQLETAADLYRGYVSLLETGRKNASPAMVARLADALGVAGTDLLRPEIVERLTRED